MDLKTVTITGSGLTLAAEVVDALYPQWAVNGHSIPLAFETVAARHVDPAITTTVENTPMTAALVETLEAEFWKRARAERAALRA